MSPRGTASKRQTHCHALNCPCCDQPAAVWRIWVMLCQMLPLVMPLSHDGDMQLQPAARPIAKGVSSK
jgi:hypothetical protein